MGAAAVSADASHAAAQRGGACGWCGRLLPATKVGRPRRYCGRSCRQRAYEQRNAVHRAGLATDAVVLSGTEFADLTDRVFQVRCAAEDIRTALAEGAPPADLAGLAQELVAAARALERLR